MPRTIHILKNQNFEKMVGLKVHGNLNIRYLFTKTGSCHSYNTRSSTSENF